ncbi:hypothetical protein [Cellulomonas fimi]|uniref:Uncharacterized protein n=1 Tax=Cellulomonas fimi TaxID=1708 RepID=A0A7Y0QJF4_CELFI|nr:hypothetical protein [Cellulomonas fimi]NMR21287.1 hypothetical protein [Cellulomonas fimi]
MQIDKSQVIDFIRSQMGEGKAKEADSELPAKVDTEQDAGLLSKFGIDPQELIRKFAGDKLGGLFG